jgi:ADP-ribosyl-[dinitrogen reductase] hydrolase
MDTVDRAGGAMLGMAIGEALGAPLEGLSHEKIQERAGRLEGFVDPRRVQPSGRAGYFQLGVYEDETQMALAAADVIIKNNGFQPEAFRDRLAELGQPVPGNAFGCLRRARRNLRTAIRKMLKGATWEQSGVNTAGSGAASRGVPIGIFYRNDEAGLMRGAIEAALVTHRDPRSLAACVLMAKGVAQALETDPAKLDIADFVKRLHATCRAAEDLMAAEYGKYLQSGFEPFLHQFSDAVLILTELTTLDLEPAFAKIVGHATGKGSRPITLATRGFSLTALLTAFYFFLTGFDVYDDTVLDVAAEGGSSDTLGCLVGALLGALHGASGIPEVFRRQLKNADQVELRGRILGGAPREGLKSLMLLEAALTPPVPKPEPKARRKGPPARDDKRGKFPNRQGRGGPRGGGRPGPGGGRGRPGGRPDGRFGKRPGGGRDDPRRGPPRSDGGRPPWRPPGPGRDARPRGPRPPMRRDGPPRPRDGGSSPSPRVPRPDAPPPPRPRGEPPT